MDCKGTISAVASTLIDFGNSDGCQVAETKAEEHAQARFKAKLEVPDLKHAKQRRKTCWEAWIEFDKELLPISIIGPNWAKAKQILQRILADFHIGPVSFTNGSEFVATKGFNSIESKLSRSTWTCTYDNFDLWCKTVYHHRALKVAMKKRYASHLHANRVDGRLRDRELYNQFRNEPDFAFKIFCFKLYQITLFTQGNRFSTVPKNKDVDRAICIEPLANILTQRRIGLGIRACLLQHGLDLQTVALKHRSLISDTKFATIDLKNASDSIHLSLVKYLLPYKIFKLIEQSRSVMTLGLDPDKNYFITEKVSSMGNGFTFELMSLILFALCQAHTDNCSVFGDDIIVPNSVADQVVTDLQRAGFVVNMKKTHINDTYRESCGAHYLDGHGYVESYDFKYPKDIGEVVTTFNKVVRLSLAYPSFSVLLVKLTELLPQALKPGIQVKPDPFYWQHRQNTADPPKLDQTILPHTNGLGANCGLKWSKSAWKNWKTFCRNVQQDPEGACMHLGFEWYDKSPEPVTLYAERHWAKYFMYLSAGRRCKDTITGRGAYKSFIAVTNIQGTTLRWSQVMAAINERGVKKPSATLNVRY
jgi:hypothetical protein